MRLAVLFLPLLACADPLLIGYEANTCADPDATEELTYEVVNGVPVVAHQGALAACGASFEPYVTTEGGVVEVREVWTGGQGDCTACMTPQISLPEAQKGRWTVRWYEGDDLIPFDSFTFRGGE